MKSEIFRLKLVSPNDRMLPSPLCFEKNKTVLVKRLRKWKISITEKHTRLSRQN